MLDEGWPPALLLGILIGVVAITPVNLWQNAKEYERGVNMVYRTAADKGFGEYKVNKYTGAIDFQWAERRFSNGIVIIEGAK